jgi:two-component system, chemotaxis family, chemotaxis protein CheV
VNNAMMEIDERSRLTSSNQFELLLFRLGGDRAGEHFELYGINVFKIREIVAMPKITPVAESHPHMLGVVKIREQIIPVIDLPAVVGCTPRTGLNLILVTEFARTTQAFAVEAVEEIVRLNWTDVVPGDDTASAAFVTSIAKVDGSAPDGRLAQILDVESILRQLGGNKDNINEDTVGAPLSLPEGQVILAADDSVIARALIETTLKTLGLNYIMTNSGKQAWDKLEELDSAASKSGVLARSKVALVLSDLEMPEMDGFTLTRKIKQDPRYAGIPVIIHSSLSGATNEAHVDGVGADAYIAKFVPDELAALLKSTLAKSAQAAR